MAKARIAKFNEALVTALDQNLDSRSHNQSPIMETIQAVGLRLFGEDKYKTVVERQLVVLSDLIQNTSHLSQIRHVGSFDEFAMGPAWPKLMSNLDGVSVTLLVLSRPQYSNVAERVRFWEQYFGATGAKLAHVQRIVG